MKPKEVTPNYLKQIFATTPYTTYTPLGLFWAEEADGTFTAVDNSTGHAWTESFPKKELAVLFLTSQMSHEEIMEEYYVMYPQVTTSPDGNTVTVQYAHFNVVVNENPQGIIVDVYGKNELLNTHTFWNELLEETNDD